jgi:hydroxymethylbilane synthase
MMEKVRIGTRRSRLAVAQAQAVADAIRTAGLAESVELVRIETVGDRRRGALAAAGGKGLFTGALEEALRCGAIDLAVHSAKDMPAAMAGDLIIAAAPPRCDARDALVSRCGDLSHLPVGARVGTGSPRRAALLRAQRTDLRIEPIRGNVDTRVEKVLGSEAGFDAVVLAMAGLERSGLLAENRAAAHPLPIDSFVPAAGQGALAVQALAANAVWVEALRAIHDSVSAEALEAERSVLRALKAGCRSCLGVHFRPLAGGWEGLAMVARADGSDRIALFAAGATAEEARQRLLNRLHLAGARRRLQQ